MQDISRCHSDEVMQVDNNCIPPSNLLGVVASPPCTTFSNYDGNRQIHRGHQRPGKPAKSSLAREHDALVANLFHYLFPALAGSGQTNGNNSDPDQTGSELLLKLGKNWPKHSEPYRIRARLQGSCKHCVHSSIYWQWDMELLHAGMSG